MATTDELREIGDLARQLSKLKEHAAWPVLRQQYDEAVDRFVRQSAHYLLDGGYDAPPVEQRKIDYQRGFMRGARWILDNPDFAEAALEKALGKNG